MKKLFSTYLFFSLIILSCKAQDSRITKNEITINDFNVFELNTEELIKNFGEPISIEDFFFEMDNQFAKQLKYDGMVIYMLRDKFDSFEITKPKYTFTKHNIRTFHNVSSLKDYFPNSYANKSDEHLSLNIANTDKYITFLLDENQRIYKIRMGDF